MTVITRFPPSPTGFLHIGGARTALFNWLFAKHHGGQFRLRIEDTDRERSTEPAVEAIFDGLRWLGLEWDGEAVMQFARAPRHREVAEAMVAAGTAYHCYASKEELDRLRAEMEANGQAFRYDGRWRDRSASEAPPGVEPVIRIKASREGEIVVADRVQGEVRVACAELDDMVLLRSDGTPTYMLAVVVDDHDMGVTYVIRGDDHLTNTFRQALIYRAMDWDMPEFAHVPMILGPDGAKLSKRHGALGVMAYRDMGYLPEALLNYLLRLGWGHGDDEIISTAQAVEWFDLDGVGKAPSRFDLAKLNHLNSHYLRERDDASLLPLAQPFVEQALGRTLSSEEIDTFALALPHLKQRAATLIELADASLFLFQEPVMNEKAWALLDEKGRAALTFALPRLEALEEWSHDALLATCTAIAAEYGIKLGQLMNPIRAAITGSNASPSMFEVMIWLGKSNSLKRITFIHS